MSDMKPEVIIERTKALPWKALARLEGESEEQRGRILRSHVERGFERNDEDLARRIELDRLLDGLMILELGFETGVLDETVETVFRNIGVPEAISHLQTLMSSQAFGRYLTTYLYTGVRFLAARIPSKDTVPLLVLS